MTSPIDLQSSASASRARTLRWLYAVLFGIDVLGGLLVGWFGDSSLAEWFSLACVVGPAGALAIGLHIGLCWPVAGRRARSVVQGLVIAGVLAAAFGLVSWFVCDSVYALQIRRTQGIGDAVIDELRAFRSTHGRWPADLSEARIDEARLSAGRFRLTFGVEVPRDLGETIAALGATSTVTPTDPVPIVSFRRGNPRASILRGVLYRAADADAWIDRSD